MRIKSIDFEAHFYTRAIFEYLKTRKDYPLVTKNKHFEGIDLQFSDQISLFQTPHFLDILCDVGEKRIKLMDEAGLEKQILSFSSPGIDEFYPDTQSASTFATEINDLLFQTIQRHPKRFMGFAAIAPYDVKNAVKELERCITQLRFVGWLPHSNFGCDTYLDDKTYWPLLEAAQALSIPIYIHPTAPLTKEFGSYGFALAGPPFGFQVDAALSFLRMVYAGVFDTFPKLKIILGHMGEMLPFLMPERIDWAYKNPNVSTLDGFIASRPQIKRTANEVILENVFFTTSGRFSKPLLNYMLETIGEDRILFATDHPYENLKQGMDFIKTSGLSSQILDKIYYQNAKHIGISL